MSLRAIQGASTGEIHTLAERLASEALARKGKGTDYNSLAIPEAMFRSAQQDVIYHPDPITGEMITAPWVMAQKVWDYKYEGKHQPMEDCVPLWQRIIVRNKKTGMYQRIEVGDLCAGKHQDYEALSYNFQANEWQFQPIVAWYDKGELDLYCVRLKDGREFFCTENHELIRYWNAGEPRGKGVPSGPTIGKRTLAQTAKELGRTSRPTQVVTAKQIPALDRVAIGTDKAWLYGIYLAEGYGRSYGNQVDIAQSKLDVRRKIEQTLNDLGVPFKFYDRGRISGGQYYRLYGEVAKELRALGLNSFDKSIPEEIFSANVEEAGAILDGLMAGDAWIPKDTDWRSKYMRCVYATSSEGIKQTVDFLALLTGRLMSHWLQLNHMGAGKEPIYRITERKLVAKAPGRHVNYHEIAPGLVNGYISSIERIGRGAACDITVADTHNFVTEDEIVLSNCDGKTTYLAALLLNRRWPVRIIAAWQTQVWPHSKIINHVYPEVKIKGRWIPLEPSSKSLRFGEQSKMVKRVKIFWLSSDGGKTYIS